MLMRKIFLLCLLLTGCAATLTDKAAKIQVHNQMSTLAAGCKTLGPVNATYSDRYKHEPVVVAEAKVKAREAAADMGADTLVITNTDETREMIPLGLKTATVQGVAMRCY